MAGLLHGVGGLVGAGVKGLLDIAEGIMHIGEEGEDVVADRPTSETALPRRDTARPVDIASSTIPTHPHSSITTSATSANSGTSSASAFSHLSISQTRLVELVDVPSGWIHLQSTYLDGTGSDRKVRSFGVKNVGDGTVHVEIGSDLGQQVVFWKGDDEKELSSAASYSTTSSASNTSGTPTISIPIQSQTTVTVFLAFTPSQSLLSTPPNPLSPSSEGGFTPRVAPALSRQRSSDVLPIPIIPGLSSGSSASDSISIGSSQSVAGSFKGSNTSSRRQEPVHRSFSVHGSITVRASIDAGQQHLALPTAQQHLALPFFATVCKSLFTAALIDPVSGLATSSQQSSGQLIIDFGTDSIVGEEYHRDILLVNRSEIELVWMTAVVNARYKDAAWFSLRDLDSENVFGVDTSSQPVPLPALSSRHLRLELRVREPVPDFSFDFVISNVNQSGNLVTCRAIGSGQPETTDTSLKVLSGTTLDFGQITDGVWAKKLITCKNARDRPLDVKFSSSPGVDVVFRLAGVAGDDVDEDIPMEKLLPSGKKVDLSRTSTRDRSRGRSIGSPLRSRASSPTSSTGRAASAYEAHHLPSQLSSQLLRLDAGSTDGESHESSGTSNRDPSLPPSRPLSRVTSRTSSYRFHTESDEDDEPLFFSNGHGDTLSASPPAAPRAESNAVECLTDRAIPNQIEELAMRPGTEYRIFVLFRPGRDTVNSPEVAGTLRTTKFKIYLDSAPSSRSSSSVPPTRHTLHCHAESCTSMVAVSSGTRIDFGEVTVGASKHTTLRIRNVSDLSAKIEIAAISKVLSTNRNVIVIPPREEVEEKMEFFPRRINERYEKQVFVRNLLNRANDQLVEIRSRNVDVNNVTLHSHLYRILTPNGANFLDFGSVIINSPTVRTLVFENLSLAPLVLALEASQPEDVELYVKLEDSQSPCRSGLTAHNYPDSTVLDRVVSPPNGDLKERFMETLRDLGARPAALLPNPRNKSRGKEKATEKPGHVAGHGAPDVDGTKQSIGAAVATALRKGGRGRPVQLYGNAVMFKDRSLLDEHEHLDLAAGPPISAHRSSPRSKKTALLDSIESEDKAKLSGQKIPKLDFAASAKATGLVSKENKTKKKAGVTGVQPQLPPSPSTRPPATSETADAMPSIATMISSAFRGSPSTPDGSGGKSPALTGKRAEPRTEMFSAADISKMTVDELLISIEQNDAQRLTAGSSWTLDEEEAFVRRTRSLRKELANLISSGRLVPARLLSLPPTSARQLIVIMTPNGSIRPHVTTRPKRADSRVFIRLKDFDRAYLSSATPNLAVHDLPVRDLIMRSNCVRSVLEVQQTSINMGNCEKGEVKSKTIVIQNKSDSIGLFRLRTSGSIASGDLQLGLGRYGVISAFGRKEVANFSFTPSLVGNYLENIVIENVLDSYQDQNVSVKANVRKQPNFAVEPAVLDFGEFDPAKDLGALSLVLANTSKSERTFIVEVLRDDLPASTDISLARDESDAGTALSKEQEEEVEGILQKLKISRRKGKADKVQKYEARLTELGVDFPSGSVAASESEADGEGAAEPDKDKENADAASNVSRDVIPEVVDTSQRESTNGPPSNSSTNGPSSNPSTGETKSPRPQASVSLLSITLAPSQKTKISVQLSRRTEASSLTAGYSNVTQGTVLARIKVNEKKNTDETIMVAVHGQLDGVQAEHPSTTEDKGTSDPLHLALMRHCLGLSELCEVSPTAFSVGSCLFIPSSSPLYALLARYFTPLDGFPDAGIIVGEGYSRQIPGNTHGEANALTNFRTRYAELAKEAEAGSELPPVAEVLQEVDCYVSLEPCSIRTSGNPSCALDLVRSKVRTVYLGVEEPPDYVQCEGVRILQDGGVKVRRTVGLEEECLKAARRGLD